ncbi:DMT family transporter [Lacibacterium aquatile]|uniref:DMT family transporter n=1 Tax=Lacibacterium aquatile TaxID=1168082 RepID=A0ABW5DMI2_9PROT
MTSERRGIFTFITAMSLSGTIGVFVTEAGTDPFTTVFWRCVFAAGLLFLYALATGLLKRPYPAPKLILLALLGGCFLVANWLALFAAFRHIPVGLATLLYNVSPFFALIFATLFLGERPGWQPVGWVAIAFGGFLLASEIGSLEGASLLGVLLTLLAASLYAGATLIGRRLKALPAPLTSLIQVSLGAVALAPFAGGISAVPGHAWGWLMALAALPTAAAYILMYDAFPRLKLPQIAVIGFTYPLVTILLDALVYGHVLGVQQWVGFALIAFASLAVTLKWRLLPRLTSAKQEMI